VKNRNRNKQVKVKETPQGRKEAKSAPEEPVMQRKAAWRLNRVQMIDPYGWHRLSLQEVQYVHSKLSEKEKQTWAEIFIDGKHWNHPVPVSELKCPDARKWMRRNMPDQDQLWTLRLSGAERIWGVFGEGVYLVIFWDPEHLIWDMPRK
jgi:hypothetical protein